jgi:hypothetical protein
VSAPLRGVRWMSDLMHPPSHRMGFTIVLKAYLDAGEPRENVPVAVVAGFVSPVTCWESFEDQWNPLMVELGLTRWHTTDFRNHRKQYETWPDAKFLYAKGQVLSVRPKRY